MIDKAPLMNKDPAAKGDYEAKGTRNASVITAIFQKNHALWLFGRVGSFVSWLYSTVGFGGLVGVLTGWIFFIDCQGLRNVENRMGIVGSA